MGRRVYSLERLTANAAQSILISAAKFDAEFPCNWFVEGFRLCNSKAVFKCTTKKLARRRGRPDKSISFYCELHALEWAKLHKIPEGAVRCAPLTAQP